MLKRILHIKQSTILVALCGAAFVAGTAAVVVDGRSQCVAAVLDTEYSQMGLSHETLVLALEHAASEHAIAIKAAKGLPSGTPQKKAVAAENAAYLATQNAAHDAYLKQRRQASLEFEAARAACIQNSPVF